MKDRIGVMLRSPEVIARTFREVQVQAGRERAELAGQKERLEARLAELKRAIARLARSDGNNGALAGELRGLNEEYAETQNRVEEVGHALESLGAGVPTEDDVREALQGLDPLWDELFPAEKERIVRLLVQEVVVSRDGLLVRLRLHGLDSLVGELVGDGPAELGTDGQLVLRSDSAPPCAAGFAGQEAPIRRVATVGVRVPMEFRVRGGRKEIILPADAATTADVGPPSPLVVALARAYRWQRMIDSGEVTGVEAIAAQHGVDRAYVSRIICVASLAPDIVAAILAGHEPTGLSLARIHRELPLLWDEQQAVLGAGA